MRALPFLVVTAIAITAHADAKGDQAAIARLDALYQPIAKLSGADRVRQACADAQKLNDLADALPHDTAPAGAAVDDQTWSSAARALGGDLEDLVDVCKTPDHKRKLLDQIETADEIVASVDRGMHAVLDAARPRDLPPAMKKFRATLRGTVVTSKSLCARQAALAKQLPRFAMAPAKSDAARWQAAVAAVKGDVESLKAGCGKPRPADEQIASGLQELHEHFYALVLLVPPR